MEKLPIAIFNVSLHRACIPFILSVFVKVKGETFAPFRASCLPNGSHFSLGHLQVACACHALSRLYDTKTLKQDLSDGINLFSNNLEKHMISKNEN